jgi:hypothetical protein
VNWGWDDREGAHCFTPPSTGCATADRTDPILERDHTTTGWTSIIGGQVYRGRCFPDLVGRYFFGDFTARALWSTRVVGGGRDRGARRGRRRRADHRDPRRWRR